MKFLADENVEWPIIEQLRKCGCDVASVSEKMSGAEDDAVLRWALKEKRILLTNDTDFGWMIYNQLKESTGIVLMRFSHESAEVKLRILKHLLKYHEGKLLYHFTVINESQIRIRPL